MSCLTRGTSIIVHSRNKGGTNRAIIISSGSFTLHLLPSKVLFSSGAYVVNDNIIIGPGILLRRVRNVASGNIRVDGLRVSAHTRIVVPCRVHVSRRSRGLGNSTGVNAAGGNVKPYCTSGIGHMNVHVNSLVSHSIFTGGLHIGVSLGGHLFRGCCNYRNFSCSRILGRCLNCTSRVHRCMGSAGCSTGLCIDRNGGILFRKTRTTVLSLSRNACPFIADSGPATNNTYANSNINPHHVRGVINIIGTCAAHINTNPFPTRRLGRINRCLHGANRRFNAIANHPHHYN